MSTEHIVLWISVGGFVLLLIGITIGHKIGYREGRERIIETEDKPPPQPTISIEAMNRADDTSRKIDNAMCDRIWKVTGVRNRMGMPAVEVDEMEAICKSVEAAALDAIGQWEPK